MKKEPFAIVTKNKDVVTNSIYNRYAKKSNSDTKSRQIVKDKFKGAYSHDNLVEPLYNMSALAHLVEVNPFHQRCVHTKAQDICGTGFSLKPTDEEQEDTSEDQKKVVKELFNNGPPLTKTLTKAETDYQSTGNLYLELVREGHLADAPYIKIVHIPAHTMRVHRDGKRYVQKRGKQKVWFKSVEMEEDVHKQTGEVSPRGSLDPSDRASEIIHDFNYCPRSDYYGLPDTMSALGAFHGHLSQRDYNIKFFENFGIPAYAVYISGDYQLEYEDEEDDEPKIVKQIRQYLDDVQTEPHSSLVFGIPSEENGKVDITFEPLAVETKDAAFRMYRKDNRDEIIVAHGVPPYRIGLAETGSLGGSTAEESTKIYASSVVDPRQTSYEYHINEYVLRKNLEVTYWRFYLNPIDAGDEVHDREALIELFENGGASPNNLIENIGNKYGIEPIDHPAMNAHYIDGQPITNVEEIQEMQGQADAQEAEMALQSIQEKLIKIAHKKEVAKNENKRNT